MANIFSQSISPEFTKQSVSEYFIDPMFMGEDIRGAITLRTDIKGTELLNRISRPSMLTKPKTGAGFDPSGSFELSTKEITVKPMALEFEQNGREFWGSIAQQLLASGYKEDDVENMSSPDIWNKIILPVIAQTGQKDLIRQMFFANPGKNLLDVDGIPTLVPDVDFNGYTGFLTHFYNDLVSGAIPANQHFPVISSGQTSFQEWEYAKNGDSNLTFTVNGIAYSIPVAGTSAQTLGNFMQEHQATIEARDGINGVNLYWDNDVALGFISKFKGQSFTVTASVDGSGVVSLDDSSPALPAIISTDSADTVLEQMLDAMPPELLELDPVFMITRSMWRNLFKTWKALGTEMANNIQFNGIATPSYEGIPIIVRPDWDTHIATSFNGVLPHKAVLTSAKNLLFATDATEDSEMLESWYNQDEQMRRYRVQYKAQTAYLHKELIVLAGFSD